MRAASDPIVSQSLSERLKVTKGGGGGRTCSWFLNRRFVFGLSRMWKSDLSLENRERERESLDWELISARVALHEGTVSRETDLHLHMTSQRTERKDCSALAFPPPPPRKRTSLTTALLRLHAASDVHFGLCLLRGSSTVPKVSEVVLRCLR